MADPELNTSIKQKGENNGIRSAPTISRQFSAKTRSAAWNLPDTKGDKPICEVVLSADDTLGLIEFCQKHLRQRNADRTVSDIPDNRRRYPAPVGGRPWPKAPYAERFNSFFCNDPKCGLHIVAYDFDDKPICEIVMSVNQTWTIIERSKAHLYDKATRRTEALSIDKPHRRLAKEDPQMTAYDFDAQDRASLHALDPNFTIDASGEIATITGRMKVEITRVEGQLRLRIRFPSGEEFIIWIYLALPPEILVARVHLMRTARSNRNTKQRFKCCAQPSTCFPRHTPIGSHRRPGAFWPGCQMMWSG